MQEDRPTQKDDAAMRRTSLKRTTPLSRGNGLKRGGRIKPRKFSKKPAEDGASLRELKDELDNLIRKIVGLRDKQCVTCFEREGLHVGHLFSRRHEHTRWRTDAVAGQCDPCNSRHNEHPEIYIERFVMTHGEDKYMELRALSRSGKKLTYTDLLAIRDGLREEAGRIHQ